MESNAKMIASLAAPFALDDHEIREGKHNKAGSKIQWFVYVRRGAITARLDDVFPLEWSFYADEPYRGSDYISVIGRLEIRGSVRTNNGGASPKRDGDPLTEDVEKAALTDCFKRCTSSWWIGLYLQNMPAIWTETYEKGNWTQMREREAQAFEQFQRWYRSTYASADESSREEEPWQPSDVKAFRAHWHQRKLYDPDLQKALGIRERWSEWQKSAKAANEAVNAYIAKQIGVEVE